MEYEVIIDTNKYSGNFEREMTGFVLGVIGDCEVGLKEATQFAEQTPFPDYNPFEDMCSYVADDHGCQRPCAISSTPGRVNDGTGKMVDADTPEGQHLHYPAYESVTMFFSYDPSEYLTFIEARAQLFCEKNDIGFVRMRVEKVETTTIRTSLLK